MTKQADKHAAGAATLAGLMNLDGLDDLMALVEEQATFSRIDVRDVKVLPQQRNADELEDDEQSLEDLAADAKELGILQPIIVCKNNKGGPEPFRLVSGERRWRAAIMAELPKVPAMVYGELPDELIDRIQYSENTQRKNLSMLNEAQVLGRDLEDLGSVKAVAEKRNKPISWISKRLQLLDLPEHTRALFAENVTSDLETLSMVRQVEKIDPEAGRAAAEAVRDAVASGGNARKAAKAEKDKVKPTKKQKPAEPTPPAVPEDAAEYLDQDDQEQESATIVTPSANAAEYDSGAGPDAVAQILGRKPGSMRTIIQEFEESQPEILAAASQWLELYHTEGQHSVYPAFVILQGIRNGGRFGSEGPGAAALSAFVSGVSAADFDLAAILEAV